MAIPEQVDPCCCYPEPVIVRSSQKISTLCCPGSGISKEITLTGPNASITLTYNPTFPDPSWTGSGDPCGDGTKLWRLSCSPAGGGNFWFLTDQDNFDFEDSSSCNPLSVTINNFAGTGCQIDITDP